MKRPEITWSLMHPTPLDPDYVRRLVGKASEYEFDSFEICGPALSRWRVFAREKTLAGGPP